MSRKNWKVVNRVYFTLRTSLNKIDITTIQNMSSAKLIRIFWKILFYGLGGFILFLILINLGVFGSLPSLKELENPSITLATEVFAEDGTPMGKYYKDKGNRSNVEFKDISPNVVNALIATEDERFYEHSGIDGYSVMRAVLKRSEERR